MDITWLGHAATRVRTRTAAVVMDPYDKSVGGTMGRPDAHIVTISHRDDPIRAGVSGVAPADGPPMVLDGPGEYEIRGVIVEGLPSALHASGDGVARGSTLYVCEADGLKWAHLGGMGTAPSADQLDVLASMDIIIVPVAMEDTLPPAEAARAIRPVEPRIVIPVGYDPANPDPLKTFVSALGTEPEAAVSRFTITRPPTEDRVQVVVLESRS